MKRILLESPSGEEAHPPKRTQKDSCRSAKVSTAPVDLASLLDVSSISFEDDLAQRFDEIAELLFFHYDIVVHNSISGQRRHLELMEMEFYLWKESCHKDPFTHASEEQKISGNWYFHRTPKSSSDSKEHSGDYPTTVATNGYRGGSRKGLDLTFGQDAPPVTSSYFNETHSDTVPGPSPHIFGGILLRTVRDQSTGEVISGPSLLVDHVLRLSGANSIATLLQSKWGGHSHAFRPLGDFTTGEHSGMFLEVRQSKKLKRTVYKSPRIGLELSNPSTEALLSHPRVHFVVKPYRYFIDPPELAVNGRAHTLLGVLRHPDRDKSGYAKDLSVTIGMRQATIQNYLDDYQKGTQGKLELSAFIGVKGKGVSSSSKKYLQMVGCIHRLMQAEVM